MPIPNQDDHLADPDQLLRDYASSQIHAVENTRAAQPRLDLVKESRHQVRMLGLDLDDRAQHAAQLCFMSFLTARQATREESVQSALDCAARAWLAIADATLRHKIMDGLQHLQSSESLWLSFQAVLAATPEASNAKHPQPVGQERVSPDDQGPMGAKPVGDDNIRKPRSRRRTWLALSLVIAMGTIALFRSDFYEPADAVNLNPQHDIQFLGERPPTKSAPEEFVLHPHEAFLFQAKHPRPLKYQWLLHIDGRVRRVAVGTDSSQPLVYQSTVTSFPRDYDLFVIVTSDTTTPLFPADGAGTLEADLDILSDNQVRDLITPAALITGKKQEAHMKEILRSGLKKTFGNAQFRVLIDQIPYQDR